MFGNNFYPFFLFTINTFLFFLQLMIHKCTCILDVHVFSFSIVVLLGECTHHLLLSLVFSVWHMQCCGQLCCTSLSTPSEVKFFYCSYSPFISCSYFSAFMQLVRLEFPSMCLIWQIKFSRC